ncbi:O-fucosyltransferase 38 [Orobanche gracilis]
MLLDDQLWEAPFGHGLHPCVKSPSKYIGNFLLYKCSWLLVLCEEVFSCPSLIVPLDLAFYMLLTKIRQHLKYSAMPVWDRYLTVQCNGGLNQMRTGIADMVAVARIMNATLVIPQLDKRSFWQDTSTFSNIFDELHFIKSLQQDVRILSELPKEVESLPRARKHFTLWSGVNYYEEMTELWKEYQILMEMNALIFILGVIHVAKSDSRLANNDLPLDIQRLRCRALFHALHFSPAIEDLGKQLTPQKLVERLRSHAGRYIALHLRYEKDVLSFSGCTSGLTDAESEELKIMREKTNHWKIKIINSTEQRIAGLCPLTPKEVGIFLQALGYPSSTLIYIAAGEIYGGDTYISELTSRFPNIVYKVSGVCNYVLIFIENFTELFVKQDFSKREGLSFSFMTGNACHERRIENVFQPCIIADCSHRL